MSDDASRPGGEAGIGTSKLLSHRARGFAEFEHSPSAFEAAARSRAPYLEVDTRATADGVLLLHHDPVLAPEFGGRLLIAEHRFERLSGVRFPNGEPLLTLEQALRSYAEVAAESQTLCLDIKDHGFEREHLDLVRSAGLEDRVAFVSWVPQVLLRLGEIGARCPLVLSHWNLAELGPVGGWLAKILAHRRIRFGRGLLMGAAAAVDRNVRAPHGFQHWLACRELPDELAGLLSGSGGGICVPKQLAGPRLAEDCSRTGHELWVFSAKTPGEYFGLASRPGVDVVFCDDAPAVLEALGA